MFVHGIHQQGKSSEALRAEWLDALAPALQTAGYAGAALEPDVPFYGDVLWELSGRKGGPAVAQGDAPVSTGEEAFLSEGLEEIADRDARIDEDDVDAEEAVISATTDQGLLSMDRRSNAIARVIERVSPLHGDFALKVLHQAWIYLKKPGAAEQVDAIVAPHFDTGPVIVVAHSLGTIVSFKLLRRLALEGRGLEVPLFVTLGSPLSLRTVRKALGPAFTPPAGVKRWLNAYDKDDFVALGQGLTKSTFADGIENWADVAGPEDDPHAIRGYLSDAKVVAALREALG
ncbi:hypothetical protein [Novosphingobium sp. 9U]|uniref:hypothetical protein n=1 Tax=Novosphingobium sp. 9U TaxID=2653158 RepID=UPI0013569A77|nr:hypothetical protein [Novosphingobium sp. 9U]